MSLTKLLGNKARALVFGAALAACSDTYNNTYVVGEDQKPKTGVELNNCEDVANRLYECDPQRFEDYEKMWGYKYNVEWQIKHRAHECEKVGFFQHAPSWIDCMEQSSCEEIREGGCEKYMVDY